MAGMNSSLLHLLVFTHTLITHLAKGAPVERMLRASGLAPEAPRDGSLIIKPTTKVNEKLLVCNAFAHSANLQMNLVRERRDLGFLDYKACRDLRLPVHENDEIDFKDGADTVGSFTISGLPADSAATLLLIVRHRRADSKAAAFVSHAFVPGSEESAQVAVIDTYLGANGTTRNRLYITYPPDAKSSAPSNHTEQLPTNTVVSINPGEYRVALARQGGPAVAGSTAPLDARGKSSYVVMRVGDEKEELVVFPSAAPRAAGALGGLLLCLAAAAHAGLGA